MIYRLDVGPCSIIYFKYVCLRHLFCLFLRFVAVLSEWYFLFFILLIIYYIILGIVCDCILQYRRISTVLPWCHAVYHSEHCQRLSFSTRYISGRIVKCRWKHLFRTGKILCRRFTYVLILSFISCCLTCTIILKYYIPFGLSLFLFSQLS